MCQDIGLRDIHTVVQEVDQTVVQEVDQTVVQERDQTVVYGPDIIQW